MQARGAKRRSADATARGGRGAFAADWTMELAQAAVVVLVRPAGPRSAFARRTPGARARVRAYRDRAQGRLYRARDPARARMDRGPRRRGHEFRRAAGARL